MTFEESKIITMTPKQAKCHITALTLLVDRMERRLEHYDRKIAEYQAVGDLPMALKQSNAKQYRIGLIAETKKEIARMQKIFGDFSDGKSNH